MLRLLAALACLIAVPALADTACDHPHNDFDGLYCLNKIYQQADADLNTEYGKLRPKLDNQGRSLLKTGQLTWIGLRNEQCSRSMDGNFYVNLQCATHLTIQRTQFLQDRTRECISAGCMNSKLD